MKPVVTWIVLANAKTTKVLEHRGTGKGLTALGRYTWHAPVARVPTDKAGVGHSIAGPAISAVEVTDAKAVNDALFAKDVIQHLAKAQSAKAFDRLVLVSGPHMLGLLRAQMNTALKAVLLGELDKDLSMQPTNGVAAHLGELLAV